MARRCEAGRLFADLRVYLTEKTDGLNLFFCFRYEKSFTNVVFLSDRLMTRWVLISFKREFPFEDVLRLWEVLWTDYYTADFVLFVALAVLESHRDVILRYLVEVSGPLLFLAKHEADVCTISRSDSLTRS